MAGSTTHRDPCGDDPWSRVKAAIAVYQPAVEGERSRSSPSHAPHERSSWGLGRKSASGAM